MTIYLIYIHLIFAFVSLALLLVRGLMQMNAQDWRAIKLLKIFPHLSDTLLLASGIGLFFIMGIGLTWRIVAKVILLITYIIFAAKYFHKSAKNTAPVLFILALVSLSAVIFLGFFH